MAYIDIGCACGTGGCGCVGLGDWLDDAGDAAGGLFQQGIEEGAGVLKDAAGAGIDKGKKFLVQHLPGGPAPAADPIVHMLAQIPGSRTLHGSLVQYGGAAIGTVAAARAACIKAGGVYNPAVGCKPKPKPMGVIGTVYPVAPASTRYPSKTKASKGGLGQVALPLAVVAAFMLLG